MRLIKQLDPLSDHLWISLAFKYLILGILCLVSSAIIGKNSWIFHFIFCLSGFLLTFFMVKKILFFDIKIFLIDLRVVFLIAFFLYFVMGSALLVLDSDESIFDAMTAYEVDAPLALKVDAINTMGFSLALFASTYFKPTTLPLLIHKIALRNFVSSKKIILFMAFIGTFSKLYTAFSDITISSSQSSAVVSAIWRMLGMVGVVAVYLSITFESTNKAWKNFALILTLITSAAGLFTFGKSEVLIPVAIYSLAYAVSRNSKKILAISLIIIYLGFSNLGGAIGYARSYSEGLSSIEGRINLLIDGFNSKATSVAAEYNAWSRLNSQAAGLEFYDNGQGGDGVIDILFWSFIPRFLAPNKPILTSSGVDFGYKLTGHDGISVGQGIYVEGYYNYGWAGVLIYSIISGIILSQLLGISQAVMRYRCYLLYPLVFLGLNIAFRIDGSFSSDYIGAFIIIIYTVFFVNITYYVFLRNKHFK